MKKQIKDVAELQKELTKLYEERPTFTQRVEVQHVHSEYEEKAVALLQKYMQKEINILKDVKLKLQV